MKAKEEGNLILKVIEYALEKDLFTLDELESHFNVHSENWPYIKNTLIADNARSSNPNHIIIIANPKYLKDGMNLNSSTSKYRLLPSAYFSYVDHLEVVEARKAAREAKKLSWTAIIISIGIGLVQIVIEVLKK